MEENNSSELKAVPEKEETGDTEDNTEKLPDSNSPTPRKRLPKGIKIVLIILCAIGILALGAYIAFRIADNYIWDNYSVTVSQKYYDGTVKRTVTLVNEPVELEEPEAIEGRVFLGWENEQGELLSPRCIAASLTETYTAKYIVDLDRENRKPYIFPDEYGRFGLENEITRGEAATMIYSVLAEHDSPSEFYPDVPKDSECYQAASELKTLGVCGGGRFFPDDYLTLGELVQMLSAFYPAAEETEELSFLKPDSEYYSAFALADDKGWLGAAGISDPDPYAPVSRGETVLFINAALDRSSDCIIPDSCATGILEYRPGDAMFIPLAQAAVGHTYEISDGKERWLTSECKAEHEEGIYFIGTGFYFIDAEGHFVRETEINGFKFGPDGVYTSGDPELDELIQTVLDEYYSPELSRDELLKKVFDYTVNSFKYKRRTFYKSGDRSYAVEAAKIMLSERTGNCYNYAATFCMLARALGYDAYVCSGVVGRDKDPHGWCEMLIDDVPYICDAELMMKKPGLDMYMKTYQQLSAWNYKEGNTYHKW